MTRSTHHHSDAAPSNNSYAATPPDPSSGRHVPTANTVAYGVFKGMGDLLAAAPVIISELNSGVHVILFTYPAVMKLVDLLNLGKNRENLRCVIFPGGHSIGRLFGFLLETSRLAPDFVWISPHSPASARSRKVSIFFRLMKTFFWQHAKLAGAESERSSWLFDIRVAVDRKLPLAERESTAYTMARWEHRRTLPPVRFKESIHACRNSDSEFDILIHPGANAENRKWPAMHFVELINALPATYRIGIVGLPNDLDAIRLLLPSTREVRYVVGSLEEAITSIARTKVLLSMDSGTTFFAAVLGVPTVALFGPVDPRSVFGSVGNLFPIYERKWPCQPCGNSRCSQSSNFCLTSILPATVAAQLRLRLGSV